MGIFETFFTGPSEEYLREPADKAGSGQGHSAPRSKGNKPKRGGKREMAAGGGSVMEEELRAVMNTSDTPVEVLTEEAPAAVTDTPEVSVPEEIDPEVEKAEEAAAELEKALGESVADVVEVPEPKEEKKTQSAEELSVFDKIRKEMSGLNTQMEELLASYPELKKEPAYTVFGRQFEKLEGQTETDQAITSHYSIVRASLNTLKRQFDDLEKKAFALEEDEEETEPDTPEVEKNKAEAAHDEDGLFAWGEEHEGKKASDTKIATQVERKLEAMQAENEHLEDLPEYAAVAEKLATLRGHEGDSTEEELAAMSEALLALQRAGVSQKVEQLKKEEAAAEALNKARESNAELAQDDPAGLFAYGEELAAQKKQPEDEKEPAGEEDLLPNYKRQEWEILDRSDWEKVARMKRDEAKQRETEKVLNRTSEQQGNENEILDAADSEVSTEGDEAVVSKKEGEARASTMERPQLFGMTIPAAGADARFAARAFQKGLLLERGHLEGKRVGVKLLQQIDDVLRVVGYVPDSGLREEDVTKLNQLVSEINQPERSGSRGLDQLDQMKAELDQKVTERLPALSGMPGHKKSYIQIAKGVMRRVLSKNKS